MNDPLALLVMAVVFAVAVAAMFAFSYWWTRVCIRAYRHGWRNAFRKPGR